jgi:hypothetical protein
MQEHVSLCSLILLTEMTQRTTGLLDARDFQFSIDRAPFFHTFVGETPKNSVISSGSKSPKLMKKLILVSLQPGCFPYTILIS